MERSGRRTKHARSSVGSQEPIAATQSADEHPAEGSGTQRPIKKIRIMMSSSPVGHQKTAPAPKENSKRSLFVDPDLKPQRRGKFIDPALEAQRKKQAVLPKHLVHHEEQEDSEDSEESSDDGQLAAATAVQVEDRNFPSYEWALQYIDTSKKLVLIIARNEGKDILAAGRSFPYGKVLKVEYEDSDSSMLIIMVDCGKGLRNAFVDENNFVLDRCGPEELQEAIRTNPNLISCLRPFIQGHVEFVKQPSPEPKKSSRKTPVQKKPIKKTPRSRHEDHEDIPSAGEEEEVVTPGGELSTGILASEQNKIRANIVKNKLVKQGQLFVLPITLIHRPPVDPVTGRRPLEIREPHNLHVQNLKKKMKINPHAIVVPFLVMVNPEQCQSVADFDAANTDDYEYFVIGGSHSAEARRQLSKEHPTTGFFLYAECKIFVGLTIEEAKLLAWDHNNDNDYRQKMTVIERIRFFHYEYLDALEKYGTKLHPGLRRQCLNEVGIVTDESAKSEGLRKYDPWFQLAFRTGEVWDLQDKIFSMWENKEVKGQKQKKAKVDPQVEIKGKSKKMDLSIEESAEDMKLSNWRSLQGIKDERLLVSVLSRVISKEINLDEMVVELTNHKVYMKIQEVMMKKLGCSSWEQVQAEYPVTSSYKALQDYFIVFKEWKPARAKKNSDTVDDCPTSFLGHIQRARHEKTRMKAKEVALPEDDSMKIFCHRASPLRPLYYNVINDDVDKMCTVLPKKDYTLAIADVPFGFRVFGSTYDEEPYKYKELEKMVKDFASLTTAPLWRFVVFHSRAQAFSVEKALKTKCHAVEYLNWTKTNINRGPSFRFISCAEYMTVGYYDEIAKKRVREHCNENGIPNVMQYPAVTRKLRHVAGDKTLVNPYQKPQRLINRLIELFSNEEDWVLDLFSGTGTTTACALKLFRNCIAIEKDEAQCVFIKMRIQAIWDCPDEDQEVGAKHIDNTERFQIASGEPMPPLADEPGELADLQEELCIVNIPEDNAVEVAEGENRNDTETLEPEEDLLCL